MFAHFMDGTSYELPALGKASWENVLARPNTGTRTVVVGLDDSSGAAVAGQVYIYAGEKTGSASPIEAGLAHGDFFGVQVEGFPVETDLTLIPADTRFALHRFGNVSGMTGATIESASKANGVTAFLRPEDGAWDPSNPNDFYFVATATYIGPSRLWRLRFDDGIVPERGGTITMLLDGNEGHHMFDNLTITRRGQILLQEDPGVPARAPDHLAVVWRYTIESRTTG